LYVYADPDLISVVLRNLINNALKFTDRDGRVEVSSRRYDNEAVVSVIDNGIGMDDETIRKIFFNGEQITTRGTFNEKGTGIGLSICKDFVRINGGELHVESKKGKGTTLSFTLAVKKEMESAGKNRKYQLHEALA
jgi:two-component system, sensor histidine kinase and response regulator